MDSSDTDMTPSYMKEEGELSDDGEIDDEEPKENAPLLFEYAHGFHPISSESNHGTFPLNTHKEHFRRESAPSSKSSREKVSRYRNNFHDRQPLRDASRRRYDQHDPYRPQIPKAYSISNPVTLSSWNDRECSVHRSYQYQDHRTAYVHERPSSRKVANSNPSNSWFRKRFRTSSGSGPSSKDEEDFEALLREHKYIQDQLEKLNSEELAANENSSETEVSANYKSKIRKDSSLVHTEKIESKSPVRTDMSSPKPNTDSKIIIQDDDEELDELELRRLALASAAEKTKLPAVMAEEEIASSNTRQEDADMLQKKKPVKKPSILPRNRHTSADRKRELEERQRRERHYEERARRKREQEERRKKEVIAEKRRQQMKEFQRREIECILTLDDPREQAERFLNVLRQGRGADLECLKQAPVTRQRKESSKKPEHVDNYEEVEMELDSDEGDAAVIETGLDDSLLYEDAVPTNNNALPPLMDFYLTPALQASLYQNIFQSYNNYQYLNMQSLPHSFPTDMPTNIPFLSEKPLSPPSHKQKPPLPPEESNSSIPPPLPPPLDPVEIPLPPPLPDSPPPPLLPSVVEEKPSPPKGKEVKEEEEDDGEELMLRQQLLLSMKKKQKEKLQEQLKGSDGSPNSSRGQSPVPINVTSKPTIKKVQSRPVQLKGSDGSPNSSRGQSPVPINVPSKPKVKKVQSRPVQIPIHKRVVIRLTEDSSSGESDSETSSNKGDTGLLEGLDTFLKVARKNVESRDGEADDKKVENNDTDGKAKISAKDNAILSSKMKDFEAELLRQRKEIEADDVRFKVMLTKIAKHLRIQTSAEETIEMLKKQLDAQEKILSDAKDTVQKTRIEARKLKQTILLHKESYKEVEQKVSLFGETYHLKTGVLSSDSVNNKRKIETARPAKEVGIKRKRLIKQEGKENKNLTRKQSLDQIAREKERLLKREKELAEKMKLLRGFNILEEKKVVKKKKEQVIPRLEKIEIDINEVVDATPKVKRRRSLMEMCKSMTPVFDRSESTLQTSTKNTVRIGSSQKLNFSIPDGKQLANLCKLQEEKMEKYLSSHQHHIQPDNTSSYLSSISSCQNTQNLNLLETNNQHQQNKDKSQFEVPKLCYRSKLLHFKSYRFNMNFRSKENLSISSSSYCSKLNPRKILCRYDLMGKCNDESCSGQHEADYKLNENEILQDIVSYWPAIAGVTDDVSAEKSKLLIAKYVERFMKQHEGKVTFDEMCLLLNSIVSRKAGKSHPNTTFLASRKWRLTIEEKVTKTNENFDLRSSEKKDEWKLNRNQKCEMENIITEQDTRYFVLTADDIQDMESAVLENPQLEDIWIKLAYKKLNDQSLDDESCLNHALNILARGIETNKTSTSLWQHYLSLYSKKCSTEEMRDICQIAVQHAPSYNIWWLYLNSVACFEKKDEICDQILLYLMHEEPLSKDEQSHFLLETVLYKIDLNVQTGRYKTGLNYIKNMLSKTNHSTESIALKMTASDRIILWLCYVHLIEFHHFPAQLYDPTSQTSGKLVNKKNVLIAWKKKSELMTKPELLLKLLWDAAQSFLPPDNSCLQALENMYLNIINLCIKVERLNTAVTICRKLHKDYPHMIEMWLCSANLYAKKSPQKTRQIFADSLAANPSKCKLYYFYAKWEHSQGSSDKAAEILVDCIKNFFQVDSSKSETCNPNFLYCKILGLELPLSFTPPPLQECANEIKDELLYIWLCYCLLLELQGEHHQATECYETAYCKLSTLEDLGQIIQSHFQYQARMITASSNSMSEVQKFQDIAKRCLTTLPNRQQIPYSNGQYWQDYSVANACIAMYIHCFPEDKWLQMYEKCIDAMPNNIKLRYRICEHYLAEGDKHMALSLCKRTLYENVVDVEFWKMVLAISLNLGMTTEVRKLYHRAVKAMPLSISLWKDFLLFEVSQGNEETARRIIDYCNEIGLNIQGFVATISK